MIAPDTDGETTKPRGLSEWTDGEWAERQMHQRVPILKNIDGGGVAGGGWLMLGELTRDVWE